MNIVNSKFNPEELNRIYRIEPFIDNFKNLRVFNDTPYFNIQKFYNNGELVGYAVIFLGYNSIMSTDASLEDIVYWKGTALELEEFLNLVYKARDYVFPIENIYYDSDKINPEYTEILNRIGYKTGRSR